MKSIDTVN